MHVTQQLLKVAAVLLSEPRAGHHGYGVAKAANLQGGTVYPMLRRLRDAGWLTEEWELSTQNAGPARRRYTLTDKGVDGLTAILENARASNEA